MVPDDDGGDDDVDDGDDDYDDNTCIEWTNSNVTILSDIW